MTNKDKNLTFRHHATVMTILLSDLKPNIGKRKKINNAHMSSAHQIKGKKKKVTLWMIQMNDVVLQRHKGLCNLNA